MNRYELHRLETVETIEWTFLPEGHPHLPEIVAEGGVHTATFLAPDWKTAMDDYKRCLAEGSLVEE